MGSWEPGACLDHLKQRAKYLQAVRHFFINRNYLEVETPVLGKTGSNDVYLKNISAEVNNQRYYLQTSPEYHMKRLLAAGSGNIFQIAKAFRDDETGRWHNPEFTMLEWYSLGINHHQLIAEVDDLLQQVFKLPALVKKSYQQIFKEVCGIDPLTDSIMTIQHRLKDYNLAYVLKSDESDRDQFLFLLMTEVIEKTLVKEQFPIALYDFPASQAQLSIVNQDIAERFEVYYQGIELANGFHELTNACQQKLRFDQDNIKRQQQNLPLMPVDERLLAALEQGLPCCSGIALGLDRLLALVMNQQRIHSVIAFAHENA